jgi:hypothetical protein
MKCGKLPRDRLSQLKNKLICFDSLLVDEMWLVPRDRLSQLKNKLICFDSLLVDEMWLAPRDRLSQTKKCDPKVALLREGYKTLVVPRRKIASQELMYLNDF